MWAVIAELLLKLQIIIEDKYIVLFSPPLTEASLPCLASPFKRRSPLVKNWKFPPSDSLKDEECAVHSAYVPLVCKDY